MPSLIGQWTSLTQFSVDNNGLTGTLPSSIGQWTSLTYFNVNSNRLRGMIPDSVGNWTQIEKMRTLSRSTTLLRVQFPVAFAVPPPWQPCRLRTVFPKWFARVILFVLIIYSLADDSSLAGRSCGFIFTLIRSLLPLPAARKTLKGSST